MLSGDRGVGYIRVDWFTPDGLSTWGDGRLTILGTDGFIEIRKNVDIGGRPGASHLFIVDNKDTRYIDSKDVVLPYGDQLVADVLNRTETAMSQAHCFLATELMLKAQAQAQTRSIRLVGSDGDEAARESGLRVSASANRWHPSCRKRAKALLDVSSWASRATVVASASSTGATGFPSIVPASVLGANSPGNRINVGAIGNGRISRGHDLPGLWKHDSARIMAVCDLDGPASRTRERSSTGTTPRRPASRTTASPPTRTIRSCSRITDVDAVVISTPDHWHAIIAIHAVQAGKDVYLQKPASLTIAEGRALSDAVHHSGRIFQIGSQQRSSPQFRYAAELVRNGRIGQLKTVEVGLPGDPSGDDEPVMPVPKNLNYDMWLGSTPVVPYTEKRVHPQSGYDRPGWLRCEQFGAGMITGWGAHHIDSAHWGMDTEYTGPIEVWGSAEFPKKGLWDVHGPFRTEAVYANGVHMIVSGDFPNGIKFIGTEGWIFVSRGNETVTASDPVSKLKDAQALVVERSENHHVGDRPERDPPVREQGSPRQLAGVHAVATAADRTGGSRAPGLLGLPDPPHGDEGQAEAALGSAEGTIQERRRGQRLALSSATPAVRPSIGSHSRSSRL